MFDYIHRKFVAYPITDNLVYPAFQDLSSNAKETYEVYSNYDLSQIYDGYKSKLFGPGLDIDYFIDYQSKKINFYLIYDLFYSYCISQRSFGRARELNEVEQDKYSSLFSSAFNINIDKTKLKYIDCCYLPGSKCIDYYNSEDDFYKEI